MKAFSDAIDYLCDHFVWGIPMIVLIFSTGVYLTVRTGFFQLVYAKLVSNETFLAIFKKRSVTKTKEKSSISQFQALTTALAATIGTGNIAGVATALAIGGPGAVFWMWLSAFFGMMTNFSENVLGIYYRKKNPKGEWSGGAMYYISEGLRTKKSWIRHIAKPLAVLFSCFCILASFGIGNISQVNNITAAFQDSFRTAFHITLEPWILGVALAILAALVILGGIKRIGKVTEKVVPFMAVAYILCTLIIFFLNIKNVPAVFGAIFKGAFGFTAAAGGISGALVKQAITMGFKRGIFSNEAGLGSSVMVHSASDVKEPVVQGMWGIFEVFFDTIVVCTLTAFSVLSSGVIDLASGQLTRPELGGVQLVTYAFGSMLHSYAGLFIAIATLFFAFSTVLGWSFYGTKAVEYLFGLKGTYIYKILFIVAIYFGAIMKLDLAWKLSDLFNGLMAIPNLIAVLLLSGIVVKITRNYINRRVKNQDEMPILSAYPEIQEEQLEKMLSEEQG